MTNSGEASNLRFEARGLVMRYGWNTTCYQILNPGISLWFDENRQAVIGYVRCQKTVVVVGAPVCQLERLPEVLAEWHEHLRVKGFGLCYFGAEARLDLLLDQRDGFTKVVLGAQPVWSASQFFHAADTDASLRYQLNRARNKGVRVDEWETSRAVGNIDLRRILDEWLQTRGLPPMHFMVEPYTLDCLEDRRLFVASIEGRPVAFVVLTPVPDRPGWLTEQFVRGFDSPNGAIELLLTEAIGKICPAGNEFVTMGIVPLSDHVPSAQRSNPDWLRWILSWFRAHGRRFYNFDGLDSFKSKFHPDYWEPIYAITKESRFSILSLYSIASAFSQGSPLLAIAEGMRRAVKQEVLWAICRS
jgi:phosphatidylglycerol lysyltransferase